VRRVGPLVVVVAMVVACPKRASTPVTTQTIRLLTETAERETTQLNEFRTDLEVDTRDFDRTPRVVAKGETPLFSAEGADVRLYGDEAASKGFAVDNFILLEVLGADGRVLRAAVIGYSDPVSQGRETIDNLGRQAFAFEPGEINLVSLLPDHGTFRLRATVLDSFGVGKVSDVFLRVEAKPSVSDDLREE
jgi:hypothetical protein